MFDPYHKWLGIPKHQRPPTFYQLLGIDPGEQDAEVIDEAAVRQTAHVRAYQVGPHAVDCTRVLNEIAQARTTLLHPTKRRDYDAGLARNGAAAVTGVSVAPPRPASSPAAENVFADLGEAPVLAAPQRREHEPLPVAEPLPEIRRTPWGLIVGLSAGAAVLVLALITALIVIFSRTPQPVVEGKGGKPPLKKIINRIVDPEPDPPAPVPPEPVKIPKPTPKPKPAPPVPPDGPRTLDGPGVVSVELLAKDAWPLAISADAKLALARVELNVVVLLDLAAGKEVYRFVAEGQQQILGAKFAPDGKSFATCGSGTVRLWSTANHAAGAVLEPRTIVWGEAAFSDDGRWLVVAASGNNQKQQLHLWDLPAGKLAGVSNQDGGAITGMAFSADGGTIFTTSHDGWLRRWPRGSQNIERALGVASGPTDRLRLPPGGRFAIAAMSHSGEFVLWRLDPEQRMPGFSSRPGGATELCVSVDGRWAVTRSGQSKGELHFWDAAKGRLLGTFSAHQTPPSTILLSADGLHLLSRAAMEPLRYTRFYPEKFGP